MHAYEAIAKALEDYHIMEAREIRLHAFKMGATIGNLIVPKEKTAND